MKKFYVAIIVFFLINNTMVYAENKAYTIFYDDEMVKVEDGEDFILFNNHLLVSPTQITRVLPFSVPGKGIWWDEDTKTITFAYFDEDDYMRARASIKVGDLILQSLINDLN